VDNRDTAANTAKAGALSQRGRALDPAVSPPNHTLSFVAGNRHQVAGRPLGWLVAGSFGRRFDFREEKQALYYLDNGALTPDFLFTGRRSTASTTVSSLGTASYELADGHRLGFTGLLARRTDDEVLTLRGFEEERKSNQTLSTARWIERSLLFGQLTGEHRVGDGELRWQGFAGQARRSEPNFVQTVYEQRDDQPFAMRLDDGTTHFYASQREEIRGGGLDFEQPLDPAKRVKLKAGALGQWKDRSFGARRFRYQQLRGPGCAELLLRPVDQVLAPGNFGSCLFLDEATAPTDAYTAEQRVLAGYLLADVKLSSAVRLVAGTRLEDGRLTLQARDPFSSGAPPVVGGYARTDALPAVNVVVALSDRTNLRLAATRTVARPQLREVAPFGFQDFFNAVRVSGNPALDRSRITNLDARVEFFPTSEEVLAVSVFSKHFDQPIEATFRPASDPTRTFTNAKTARNLGAELEARRSLGFLTEALRRFSVVGNVSLVHSRVELDEKSKTLEGGEDRPLQGQAPWVVNLALDWQSPSEATRARLSYNVLGRRIDTVGFDRLPDIYEAPRHVVDLSVAQAIGAHLDLKLALENLLNAPFVFTQGDRETSRWTLGSTAWITVTYATER
jgi:TonB-dependent receptor